MAARPSLQFGNRETLAAYVDKVNSQHLTSHASSQSATGEPLPPLQACALWLIHFTGFDVLVGVVIMANIVVMVIETDRSAMEEYKDEDPPLWIDVFGWSALGFFVLELIVRLLALRQKFWKDAWNVADFIIVVADAIMTLVSIVAANVFPVSILRIFRLSKLARVSKVLRVFPELRLLLAGIVSSLSAIFWGCFLLFFFLLIWAMIAVVFIHPLNKDLDYGDGCDRCRRAYSTVMQAALTFWQQIITGDSWGATTIPLLEQHPQTALFFFPVFISVGMAVMNLMLGVVVSVAQQAKDDMQAEMIAEKALHELAAQSQLIDICRQMDKDNSGELSREEVLLGFEEPGEFQNATADLGIGREEFDIAWATMDSDGSGTVSYKELIQYLCKMTQSDTQFMLAYIKYHLSEIKNTLNKNHDEEMKLETKLEEELHKVHGSEDILFAEQRSSLKYLHEGSSDSRLVAASASMPEDFKGAPVYSVLSTESKASSSYGKAGSSKGNQGSYPSLGKENLTTPVQKNKRRSGNMVTLASMHDDMEIWLARVCHDIALVRFEMKDILSDVKFGTHASIPEEVDRFNAGSPPDLLVMPGRPQTKGSRCSSCLWCASSAPPTSSPPPTTSPPAAGKLPEPVLSEHTATSQKAATSQNAATPLGDPEKLIVNKI